MSAFRSQFGSIHLPRASIHSGSIHVPRGLIDVRREMAVGAPQATKRALVKVLLVLAAFYTVNVTVSRESTDEEVLSAYKKVSLKAHPDKGGRLEHCQELNNAKDAWDKARRTTKAGRPKQGGRDQGDNARPGTRPAKRKRAEDPPAALDGGGFDGA